MATTSLCYWTDTKNKRVDLRKMQLWKQKELKLHKKFHLTGPQKWGRLRLQTLDLRKGCMGAQNEKQTDFTTNNSTLR